MDGINQAKQERQPAFQTLFERLEKSIIINKELIESCHFKSQKLNGIVPSEIDEALKQGLSDNEPTINEPTIIEVLNTYSSLIERNNSLLRQVLQELNNAI